MGKEVVLQNVPNLVDISWLDVVSRSLIAMGLSTLIFVIFFTVVWLDKGREGGLYDAVVRGGGVVRTVVGLIVIAYFMTWGIMLYTIRVDVIPKEMVEKWEDEYVSEYIEGLPYESTQSIRKIEFISLSRAWVVYEIDSMLEDRVVSVEYLEGIDKPYLTYKKNDTDFRVEDASYLEGIRWYESWDWYLEGDILDMKLFVPLDTEVDIKRGYFRRD